MNILTKKRAQKKIKTLIERTDKLDLLRSMWIIDRTWCDPEFVCPQGYDFPQELFTGDISNPNKIHAWEIETLVTEIFYWPRKDGPKIGNAKAWGLVRQLVNTLRKLENAEYRSGTDITREMSRIFFRQIPWQPNDWQGADFVRWWSIFEDPNLISIFKKKTGIALPNFIVIGLLWNEYFNESFLVSKPSISTLKKVSTEDIDKFIALTSISQEMATEEARRIKLSSNTVAFKESFLRPRPLIRVKTQGDISYLRPLEMLLKWRLSSGLYYDVIEDVQSRNLIGDAFEDYIRDLLKAKLKGYEVREPIPYGTKQKYKESPDALICKNDVVCMMVECKAVKLTLPVQISLEDTEDRERVIKDLAKGVKQLCEFEQSLLQGIEKIDLELDNQTIPILVTLDNFIFLSHDLKNSIFTKAKELALKDGINTDRIEKNEIVLCTSAELEHLMTCFSVDSTFEILRDSIKKENRNNVFPAVMNQHSDKKLELPKHPLSERINKFLSHFLQENNTY